MPPMTWLDLARPSMPCFRHFIWFRQAVSSLSHSIHALCHLQPHSPCSILRGTCLFVFCFRSLPLLDSKYNFFCICRAPVRGCQLLSLLVACDNIFARIKALAARACACASACDLSVTVPAPLPVNRILDADNNEIMSAKETYFLWRLCFWCWP